MAKISKILVLLLVIGLCLSLISLPSVYADTELPNGTFELFSGGYVQFSIYLEKNDILDGNFILSEVENDTYTYVNVIMIMSNPYFNQPDNHSNILDFHLIKKDTQYSFNCLVNNSFTYLFIFYSSYPIDVKKPQITFNYTVRESNPLKINLLTPQNMT
jgi:hypothetical protein